MVQTGLDVLLSEGAPSLRGRKVGVLCHAPSVNAELVHIVDALRALDIKPQCLFGPEHGVLGGAQDMEAVVEEGGGSGVPIVSLYGSSLSSLRPDPKHLEDLDVVLVDLQDVGARYYTYVWTMGLLMEVAAETGTQVVVLDRPNPLGGRDTDIEGGFIQDGFDSFVGLGSVPVRHGLTIGELAKMLAAGALPPGGHFDKAIPVELEVIAMRGWTRSMWFDETGLPWVMPSPNMPTLDTAVVYPGMCLVEGTNLSEGRGTTRPFELCGAPFLDAGAVARAFDKLHVPGVRVRPVGFQPTFQKHAGATCGGIQFHVTDRSALNPLGMGLAFLLVARACGGDAFGWRRDAYEFVTDRLAIDLLAGGTEVRHAVEAEASLDDLTGIYTQDERAFEAMRAPFLMYDEADV